MGFEEKRARMMEIFFETKDVFQLKDIEKIAPKEKGITSMSVKEILQSLVDDGMVDTDRIGTSNYFWAFPSKALHARKRKLEELQGAIFKQIFALAACSVCAPDVFLQPASKHPHASCAST
uniref:Meiotic nuclear divisions 1 n=1 Tax=Nothoprocta perdicaria TaxID=30464 RepID=A0A8C7E9C2_NOTPE